LRDAEADLPRGDLLTVWASSNITKSFAKM
jgi:hypothetical protein